MIAAAAKLFATVRVDKVSVADIAEGAGVHQVAVYRHFADRDTVVNEVDRRSEPTFECARQGSPHRTGSRKILRMQW